MNTNSQFSVLFIAIKKVGRCSKDDEKTICSSFRMPNCMSYAHDRQIPCRYCKHKDHIDFTLLHYV